jgi:hypothetical protein
MFIWNLAHILEKEYDCPVNIFYVDDRHARVDRPLELKFLLDHCDHRISISKSNSLGKLLIFRDKLASINPSLTQLVDLIIGLEQITDPTDSPRLGRKKPRVLRGFFQNSRLVEEGWSSIVEEIKSVIKEQNVDGLQLDLESGYQAVHVRRGDFVELKENLGLLAIDYYVRNLKDGTAAGLVVCTDDDRYVAQLEQTFKGSRVIGPREASPWQSFAILASSSRLIIANSTFSWWAGNYVCKMSGEVIAPEPWFKNQELSGPFPGIAGFVFVPAEFD